MKKEWLILLAFTGAFLLYSRLTLKNKIEKTHACTSGCKHHHHH